ncbi:MAG: hypothetical protein HZB51_22925 [Chloroflexi bacterium]|nr:hypothetical protein [Chloroflexota bacterium]
MIQLFHWTVTLVGPFYLMLLMGLYVGRRLNPDARIWVEVNEPMLIVVASILALAVAGVIVQIV